MEKIAFFSSDFRELYKGDIFRTLALPPGYIIHFRYQKQYIDENIKSNLKEIIGNSGIIYFTVNNKLESQLGNTTLQNISIREVIIEDCEESDNTSLVHFYLKLGQFIDVSIDSNNAAEKQPPNKFVTKLNYTQGDKNQWIDRIDVVKSYFPNLLFFTINTIRDKNNKKIVPKYSSVEKQSIFELRDQSKYFLEISFYDKSDDKIGFKIEEKGKIISINSPSIIKIGANKDDKKIPFLTHSLDVIDSSTFLNLILENQDIENTEKLKNYTVILEFNLKKYILKPILFGFFSALAFMALLIGNYGSNPKSFSMSLVFVSIVLVGISAGLLYFVFNKK